MKDKNMFELVGAVKKVYANDKGTFAVLTLETSAAGRRTNHEIKGFQDNVELIRGLRVGEVIEVKGSVGRMTSKECEFAKMPYRAGATEDQKFYPAIPTLNITSITKAQQSVGDDNFDDDKVPD